MALEKRLTTVADNMANVNTVGFRGTEVKFDEILSRTQNDLNAKVAFVSQGNDYLSTHAGEYQQTGNPLDFAVKGDAWFAVDTPQGQVLTRDGRFTIKDTGELVSIRGYPVLDVGGAPIQLNRAGGPPEVGADGKLIQDGREVAQLGVFTVDVTKGFLRHDNSGITTTDTPQPVVDNRDVSVMQGYVENSNVNGISEMTQLIEINRLFESVSSMVSDSETSMSDAIKTLGGTR